MGIEIYHHAKHNQDLAEKLFKENEYLDWVVTTAYYSCVRYVHHHLFPFEDHGVQGVHIPFNSFDDYCDAIGARDKHGALCDLFSKEIDQKHGLSLRKLMNDCKIARYINYKTSTELARSAISTVQSIEKICTKKRAKRTRVTGK